MESARTGPHNASGRGNTYLRELFIQGAQSSFVYLKRDQSSLGQWLRQVETCRQRQAAIVALANKMVRICWMRDDERSFREELERTLRGNDPTHLTHPTNATQRGPSALDVTRRLRDLFRPETIVTTDVGSIKLIV